MTPEQALRSAIIGWYRQGAIIGKIAELAGLWPREVEDIINCYLQEKEKENVLHDE